MFDPSRIQFTINDIHRRMEAGAAGAAKCPLTGLPALAQTDGEDLLVGTMAMAMSEIRLDRGAVTERDLERCGFTPQELRRFGARARAKAADNWHRRNLSAVAA